MIPSDWIKKSILYCDSISSIYPYGFSPDDGIRENQSLADMNYLKSEGLYTYSRPEDLSHREFDKILKELQSRISEDYADELRTNFSSSRVKYEIYKSKLDSEIITYLFEMGLAEESKIGDSILVENDTALTYMSLLSAFSSNIENQYVPATNSNIYKNILYPSNPELVNDNSMSIIFDKLPSPDTKNSLEDIIRFKNKYPNDLLHLRGFITEWTNRLKSSPNNTTINAFDDEFGRLTSDFKRMYASERLSWTLDSLEILVPFVITTAFMLNNENIDFDTMKIGGLTTSASLAINRVRNILTNRNTQNPLTYLYEGKRNIIL